MLQIVYFCEEDGKSSMKDYLDGLIQSADDLEAQGKTKRAGQMRNLAFRLLSIIRHAAEHEGIVHPPLGDKMHAYPFFELRQRHGKRLIRIFYFAYHKEKLVLLHMYEKNEGESARQGEMEQANRNYKTYISNPEKYEIIHL